MNPSCCDARGTVPSSGPVRSWLKAAGGALPGAIAVLLPKCPLCLAAWIATGTGIALPAAVASSVRPSLAIACVFSAFLLVRRAFARCQANVKTLLDSLGKPCHTPN